MALSSHQPLPELLVGGYQPIKNSNDLHVQEIAKFAVSEHNKQANETLEYVKVIKGEYQIVAGVNYKLLVAAKHDGVANHYEAVVYEKSWESFKQLTSFKPLLG